MEDKSNRPLKTAFYLRVSTDEQAEKYGMDAQETALRALLKSKGTFPDGSDKLLEPDSHHIYKDDVSGTTPLVERPGFSRLLEDIVNSPPDDKPFDVILVYKIDRFARKLRILLETIDFFENNKLTFISASESIDTSTPFGRAMLGIVGVIAELEIETIKQRTHAGKQEAMKQGMYPAPAPYGYRKDNLKRLIIYEEEAIIVRRIFHEFVYLKLTPYAIAQKLIKEEVLNPRFSSVSKSRNVRSKNAKWFWHEQTIRRLLCHEIYIGDYYFNKTKGKKLLPRAEWELSPYRHPSIIEDVSTYYQAQKLLESYASKLGKKDREESQHLYLLRSLLKCDCCFNQIDKTDERVTWHGTKDNIGIGKSSYTYICRRKNKAKSSDRCRALPLPAGELELYVVNFIKNLLSDPKKTFDYQQKLKSSKTEMKYLLEKKQQYINLINGCNTIMENIKFQHKHGHASASELEQTMKDTGERRVGLEKELKRINEQIAEHQLSENYIGAFSLFKDAYIDVLSDLHTKRNEVYEIIHYLIEEIVVKTRPLTDKDKVAGKKTQNQQMPYRLEFKLKLPQEFLLQLKMDAERRLQASVTDTLSKLKQDEFQVKERSW